MNPDLEIVQYQHKLNARILVHGIDCYKLHWHREIELILVLKGNISLTLNGRKQFLSEDDLVLINSEEIHSTMGDGDNSIAVVQINPDFCARIFPELGRLIFLWDSALPLKTDFVRQMRYFIACMMDEYRKTETGYQLNIEGLLNAMTALLIRNIPTVEKPDINGVSTADQATRERIKRIIDYVQEHYAEKISLTDLAENVAYVSAFYLSHFFKEKIGLSFLEYLNLVRLKNAVNLLYSTPIKISDIAMSCGFGSIKAFNTAFKKQYRISPHTMRSQRDFFAVLTEQSTYLKYDSRYVLKKLKTYMENNAGVADSGSDLPVPNAGAPPLRLAINAVPKKAALFPRWERLAAVGRAYDLLREDLRSQVREAAQVLGIRHLRFHGIFNDEMRVVSRDGGGNLHFYWSYVDNVFDFLLEIGVCPMVDCTFMPNALKSDERTVFWYRSNISPPADLGEWSRLVRAFALHCVERYGIRRVCEWYFEVWNEPELFWGRQAEDYFPFYEATVRALREADSLLRIAGPAALQTLKNTEKWIDRFIDFLNSRELPLDCFTFHLYGEDNIVWGGGFIGQLGDQTYFAKSIAWYQSKISRLDKAPNEIFITEFNLSAKHGNYLLDTMFAACYLLYNYLQNHDQVNGIAYWTLSDIFEEDSLSAPPFGGGFGLITREGIKKSSWWALWFLEQLGGGIIAHNTGIDDESSVKYCVTEQDGVIAVLAFNYVFYDRFFKNGDSSLLSYGARYDCFDKKPPVPFGIELEGLSGTYEIREYVLDRENGSAFDIFVRMGMPQTLSPEDAAYLRAEARPRREIKNLAINGPFSRRFILPPHGIRLIVLKKISDEQNSAGKESVVYR